MTIVSESSAPLLVVVGSTGAQGGSVIKALAASDKPYRIRGLTRNITKPVAQQLASIGVELFGVDPTPENKGEVVKAFQGAYIVFANTLTSKFDQEIIEGKMLADAAKTANVGIFVWSGLMDFDEISNGKYPNVWFFDHKAEVTAYARSIGLNVLDVQAAMYMSNFLFSTAIPAKQSDGSYVIYGTVPGDAVAPLIDTEEDYGLFVRKALEVHSAGEYYATSELITFNELAKQLGQVTGKKVSYRHVSDQEYLDWMVSTGKPLGFAQAYCEMYKVIHEFGYFGSADLEGEKQGLARPTGTWRGFVQRNDWSTVLD